MAFLCNSSLFLLSTLSLSIITISGVVRAVLQKDLSLINSFIHLKVCICIRGRYLKTFPKLFQNFFATFLLPLHYFFVCFFCYFSVTFLQRYCYFSATFPLRLVYHFSQLQLKVTKFNIVQRLILNFVFVFRNNTQYTVLRLNPPCQSSVGSKFDADKISTSLT